MKERLSLLAENAGCSECVANACLPSSGPSHGAGCWIAGWGETAPGSGELSRLGLKLIKFSELIKTYKLVFKLSF